MIYSSTQHALREVRRVFSLTIAQIILISLIALLAISGPFGTLDAMPFGPRLAYWAITAPVTFAVGVLVSSFVTEMLNTAKSEWLVRIAVACATAITVTLSVLCINWLAFGTRPVNLFATLSVMATAGVIALVIHYMSNQDTQTDPVGKTPAPLLERLELNKRGALISMSVQDHYVEVTTSAGASLILMRLSDAMRETGDVEGLQVHRSHWVARAHVKAAERVGDKAVLSLSDGRQLPASRSHIKSLKDAGILPR